MKVPVIQLRNPKGETRLKGQGLGCSGLGRAMDHAGRGQKAVNSCVLSTGERAALVQARGVDTHMTEAWVGGAGHGLNYLRNCAKDERRRGPGTALEGRCEARAEVGSKKGQAKEVEAKPGGILGIRESREERSQLF